MKRPTRSSGLERKWGASGLDHIDWKVAMAHYDAERLPQALEAALDVGIGQSTAYLSIFRTIEAEAITRERSRVINVGQKVELEFVSEEAEVFLDRLTPLALSAFDEVSARFGYRQEADVRLTVLSQETDAPWLFGRYGYCVAKDPYFKICIPLHLVHRPDELSRTLKHEYAHVVVGSLSGRKAPRWLDEAAAMAAESSFLRQEARDFASGREEWLDADELNAELRYAEDERGRWLAYAQAGLIGLYLAKHYGEPKIAELARSFSSADFFPTLISRLKGEGDDESAIRRTFGIRRQALFESALDWVRADRR